MIHAGYGRVLVRPLGEGDEAEMASGVLVAGNDGLRRGEVLSLGWPDEKLRAWDLDPGASPWVSWIDVGDIVLYAAEVMDNKGEMRQKAVTIIHDGERLDLVLQAEVRAIVRD